MRIRRSVLAVALASIAAAAGAVTHDVTVGPGNTFSPAQLTIQAGDTVRWTNAGGIHNVVADGGAFGSGAPSGNSWVYDFTFPSAGSFPYYCGVHGAPGGAGMSGVVTVQGGTGGAPGSLRFSNASYSVSEGAASATINVQRVGGDDGAVSVQYATANGTAQSGSDYTAANGTLNWADNDDTSKSFTVPILGDSDDEANETVQLTLSNPGGGAALGSPSAATLTIQDDDAPAGSPGNLRFTSSTYSVGEGAASAQLTVERVGGTTGEVSAQYATANGSAVAGSDFMASSGDVTFGAGDGASKTIDVPLLDDGVEEAVETFSVALSSPSGGAGLGNPSQATVSISDDDFPTVCIPDEVTLCLNQGRFRVRVQWTDFQGQTGPGSALPYTADSGFFYFFGPDNLEILIKVLNGCVPFERYWVFYAAATNVEYAIEVVDTQRGAAKVYTNDAGVFAPATGDTDAFATCP